MVRPGRDRLFGCVEGDERYWGSEKEGVRGRSVPLREGSCVPQNYGMSRGALLGNCATEQKNRISGSWCVQTATAPALLLRNPLRTSKRPGSRFIPANPSMGSSVRRRTLRPVDRPSFLLFVRVVLPESGQEGQSGRSPGDWVQKPLAVRTFIVQNGPAWS
jgi:hypothetical protein